MEEILENHRYKDGRRFFIYAPPLKGMRQSKRKNLPNPPFAGAPAFKASVYYYWWEFLRRSAAYKKCCECGGRGKLSKMFSDFGDVFQTNDSELDTFWNWWTSKHPNTGENRGQTLFAEPPARHLAEIGLPTELSDSDTLVIQVPLELRSAYLVEQFRKVLQEHDKRHRTAQAKSRALYPVHTKPVLSALHTALVVYDACEANDNTKSKKKLWQLFDELTERLDYFYVSESVVYKGLDDDKDETLDLPKMEKALANGTISFEDESLIKEVRKIVRSRKANAVKRQQRIAKQYIANAERGEFPKKSNR